MKEGPSSQLRGPVGGTDEKNSACRAEAQQTKGIVIFPVIHLPVAMWHNFVQLQGQLLRQMKKTREIFHPLLLSMDI